ncbi:hypothetical protein GCM10027445_30240 [Amycolatopsis endophytica]|uniref:Tetracyclin repressor SlmA-like C-terminal domain-containing protein n=2 Tax=Amycolatopsis endophytica TaxID=860233 RepID=A0A853BA73_9PSEU|nr:hypothetical protein [Amycolatopsis endophytica]
MAATDRFRREGLPGALEEMIRVMVHTAIGNHVEDPHLLRVMAEQGPRAPQLLDQIRRNYQERVEFIRELLDAHPEVRVADTDTAAKLAVSTVELVVHQLVAAPEPIDTGRLENELVGMLTRYLRG